MTLRRPCLRLGMLVSGGGRTVINLHEHIRAGELNATIEVVICSRTDALAVRRARDAGLGVEIVDRKSVPDPQFHDRIAELLRAAAVELVCMAGFYCLWRIPPDFAGRVINIHPALLPQFGGQGFYGDRVHQAVLASGAKESGCTVHLADDAYDHGPAILQRRVPVFENDTPATLASRVFEEECTAYPQAVAMFADGRWPLPYSPSGPGLRLPRE